MKKRIIFLLILLMIIFIPNAKAAGSATMSLTPSSMSVVVGNYFDVDLTISTNEPFAGFEYVIQYDQDILSLVSTDAISGGAKNADTVPQDVYYKTISYTFRARQSGYATISITNEIVSDQNYVEFNVSKYTSSIYVMTQAELEASYSSNNNLSSLGIGGYDLTPGFSPDITEYSVTLNPETEVVNVYATKEDYTSGVYGIGEINVGDGVNQIKVQVIAENGNVKFYTINATVKELDPIDIKVDGSIYSVVRKKKILTMPNSLFKESTTSIQGNEVPCFVNDITKTIVIGLKNQEGEIFYYVKDNDTYYQYQEIKTAGTSLMYLGSNETPYSYMPKQVSIGENTYDAYVKEENSRFYLLYGMNLSNGNKGFYSYDNYENTLQRVELDDGSKVKEQEAKTKKIELFLAGFAIFFFILFIANFIISYIRVKKIKNKYKKHINDVNDSSKEIKKEPKKEESKEVVEEKEEVKEIEDTKEVIEEKETKEIERQEEKESITQVIESLKQEEKKTKPRKRKNVK